MKQGQECRFLPVLLFPDVVWTLTPTVSGSFELTTFTLPTGEKVQVRNFPIRVQRLASYKNLSNIYYPKHISIEYEYQAR
jgi:hypothetical protein